MKIKRAAFVLAGVLYMWIITGNLLGHILVSVGGLPYKEVPVVINEEPQFDDCGRPLTETQQVKACYPQWVMWGGFETHCDSLLGTIFWLLLVGVPRFLILVHYTALSLVRDLNPIEAAVWILWSLPVTFLILIPGFFYWKKRNAALAYSSLAILIVILVCMSDL